MTGARLGFSASPSKRRSESGGRPVYAAIDLGTSNCRLLVAITTEDGFRVIDAFSRIVRLGEGLNASRRLTEAAMARTLAALKVCAGKIRRRRVTHLRAVATEACRRAHNCDSFLARVRTETGLDLEIISSKEEAILAIHGCAALVDPDIPNALIFDIGGGSTEVSLFRLENEGPWPGRRRVRLEDWRSVPWGVMTLAERHGGPEVSAEVYEAMVEQVRGALEEFERSHGLAERAARGQIQMLGTSGTVTTLAGIRLELPRYNRAAVDGCYLDRQAIEDTIRAVTAMDYRARVNHPCIGNGRADLVVAGCAILQALGQLWPVPGLRVADRGLREGMLLSLMREAESRAADRKPAPASDSGRR